MSGRFRQQWTPLAACAWTRRSRQRHQARRSCRIPWSVRRAGAPVGGATRQRPSAARNATAWLSLHCCATHVRKLRGALITQRQTPRCFYQQPRRALPAALLPNGWAVRRKVQQKAQATRVHYSARAYRFGRVDNCKVRRLVTPGCAWRWRYRRSLKVWLQAGVPQ